MEKIVPIICSIFISALISGCISTGNIRMKDQTQASIDKIIIKGQTTSVEMLERFGDASKKEPTLSRGEYWWYFYSYSAIDPLSYTIANIDPQGSFYGRVSLMIEFNKEGIVSNYKFRKTEVQNPYFGNKNSDKD
jgi:hypothetical protein